MLNSFYVFLFLYGLELFDDENDTNGLKRQTARMLNRPSHTPLHPISLNFAPKLSQPQWGACDSSCQSPSVAFHPPKFTPLHIFIRVPSRVTNLAGNLNLVTLIGP